MLSCPKPNICPLAGHLINGAYELAEAVSELQPGVPRGFRAMSGFKFVAAPSIPGIVRYTARLANGHVRFAGASPSWLECCGVRTEP